MPPAKIALAISLLFASVAYAQEPSEADKVAALKIAYELNDRSMVRWASIDLGEIPLADPKIKNEIDSLADRVLVPPPRARVKLAENNDGICARHRMHKVWYGDKWRCRK